MTNPNCEYGANFVAIHSLALWSRCTVDGCESLSNHEAVSSDIKLELGEPVSSVPPPPNNLPAHVYHPRHALRAAMTEWLPEFYKVKPMWGPVTKPQVGLNPVGALQPSVNTCLTTTSTTSSINTPVPMGIMSNPPIIPKPESEVIQNPVEAINAHAQNLPQLPLVTPLVPVMNSLVSHNVVVMERSVTETTDLKPEPMEVIPGAESLTCSSPGHTMELATTAPSTPAMAAEMSDTNPPTPASVMQTEPETESVTSNGMTKAESTTMLCDPSDPGVMAVDELELLCDMFYLPWEHGPRAMQILSEFYWLKTHAGVMLAAPGQVYQAEEDEVDQVQVERPDWLKRKEKFQAMAQELRRAFEKFCNSPNRELVYNLYTYLWDIVSVVLMLVSYVDWLSMGRFSNKYKQLVIGRHTWFSGIREAFCSGDHEPWVFRGGLAADLQRLMPVDSGNDLFLYPHPDSPTSQIYTIRPFVPDTDTAACHSVALQTWDDGMDATQYFTGHPTLPGEKTIGPFINFYPEYGFVLENSSGEIVGFAFAAPNIREYHQRLTNVWLPELRFRFPPVEQGEGELLTPGEVVINSLHKDPEPLPGYVEAPETWGLIKLCVLPAVLDASLSRRAVLLILACLRTSGTLKVVSEVTRKEKYVYDLFKKLGKSVVILLIDAVMVMVIYFQDLCRLQKVL